MSASSDHWLATLEAIAEEYAASDQMPSDFADALKRMVGMGLNRDEATNMLQEAVS